MRFQRGVELVLDHAGLHAHAAVFDIDGEDAGHVPGDIDHEPVGERLPVRARAAAARGEREGMEPRVVGKAREAHEIVGAAGVGDGLGRDGVDRVVAASTVRSAKPADRSPSKPRARNSARKSA